MPDREEVVRAASEMAAWAAAGAATGGSVGAAWGAAGPLLQRLVADFARHSWAELAGYATEYRPIEEVVERLTGTPGGQELLLSALDAARWTTHEQKLRALGRTLARAAEDVARIDNEALMIEAVSRLSSQHMRIIDALLRHNPTEREGWLTFTDIESIAHVHDGDAWMSSLVGVGVALVRYAKEGQVAQYQLSQLGYRLIFRAMGWDDYDL